MPENPPVRASPPHSAFGVVGQRPRTVFVPAPLDPQLFVAFAANNHNTAAGRYAVLISVMQVIFAARRQLT